MADLAANIGANFSNYVGNPNLGGALDFGALNIDTKPIENLGYYTMIYNKAEQEKKEKEVQAQAAKLADLTAYDLTTAIPKDREIIQAEYDKLYEAARKDPTVLDYKNNPKGYLAFGKMKNDFTNKLKGAKVRSIGYLARQEDINNETNADLKAIKQKQLDQDIANSDINTPLRITEKFDLTAPEIPIPQSKTFDVSVIEDNQNVKREYNIPDVKGAWDAAHASVLGMLDKTLDEKSPEFLSKTPEEQSLLRSQNAQRIAAKTLLPIEQAKQFNSAIQQYMSADEPGQVDIEQIKSKNPMLFGVIQQYENYNNFARKISDQIRAGVFKDKLGNTVQFGTNGLDESDFRPISYTDGITPDEIVFLQSMAKAKTSGYKTTIQPTDNAQQENQLKETTRHNKAMENIDRAQLDQKKKEWQTQQDASETVSNDAWNFAKQKYAELEKLAVNGIITPDKIRQIPADVLKYLGTEQAAIPAKRDANGTIIESEVPAGFRPLSFGDQTSSPTLPDGKPNPDYQAWAIGLDNGKIKVLKVEKNLSNKEVNHLKGLFDNTKSTSIDNIATNRLKEELKAAGPKELNSFQGLDENQKGGTKNTTGSTKSSAGSSGASTSKEIKRGDVATKAAAAGYTPKEYEALLKKNGVKIID